MSVAALVGTPVVNTAGDEAGRLVDVVVAGGGDYPPVIGLVVRIGRRHVWIRARQVAKLGPDEVRLSSARLDLDDYLRRPGEIRLIEDVLDHQLVDVDGARVVRAADLYLVHTPNGIRLVGVDVGFRTLLRRVRSTRALRHPEPGQVVDWAAIQTLAGPGTLRLRDPGHALRRLHPAELADLVEELGRAERHELLAALAPAEAADVLEEMEPDAVGAVLRESPVERAAELLEEMEPDEAVDALRDLPEEKRDELLAAMPVDTADSLLGLLAFPEQAAGGLMTARLVLVAPTDTVADVRTRLRDELEHQGEIDAVTVVGDDHVLLDDVSTLELFVADDRHTMADLCRPPWPITVLPDTELSALVDRFIESRRSSVLVVDDENRPIGRILADDVIDALVPEQARLGFLRLWPRS